METAEFVRTLDREGRLLAVAAEEAGPGARVPTCPEWRIEDLVGHTGVVHRWATAFVTEGHTASRPLPAAPGLDGDALSGWFRLGHRHLVDALAAASPGLDCWHFLPAPSPLAFWARRQAHETTIHRVDAESARRGTPTPIDPAFAADGIDEVLRGFHGRSRSRVRTEEPRVLRVRTTDGDGATWTVRLSPETPVTERGDAGDADCEVAGTAAELYLALWNRAPFPAVTGDTAVAGLWRSTSAV
ncbi:maleylpyruvate isomerase family mycothiol-dependent enzyme [Streptomyces sp. NPDC101249]|uniref:maleylpyruvate isomerase family mycothiol-dependent enzyme n=1 Tax=Streptomyces sp. NPDC101249 TaxID=3366140 RepID=UPI0038030AEF